MTGEVTDRPEATLILAVTQAGGTSVQFSVGMSPVVVRIRGDNLAPSETCTIQVLDGGLNWKDANSVLLGAFVLEANENMLTIYDTGTYRAVLTATAGDCGVEILGRNYC
jgi:hypothetical protein